MTKNSNILAIVVVYKRLFSMSETIQSIKKLAIDLFIYDNSPEEFIQEKIKELATNCDIEYVRDVSNPGICKAYNKGFQKAVQANKKWVLLLDQDTILPPNYFEIFYEQYKENYCQNPVAYVPQLKHQGKLISPLKVSNSGITHSLDEKNLTIGLYGDISALNSGVFISTEFLRKIGEFSQKYPLDLLDHWLFKKISQQKQKIVVLPIVIQHNLSLFSKEGIDNKRYISILNGESVFLNEFGSYTDKFIYRLRLIRRILLLCIKGYWKRCFFCLKILIK
ncbi:MAG: glycosyltransferase [Bacteroidales bacterium]|nr:glycosyltransferase [Bacteroidales bacterium]